MVRFFTSCVTIVVRQVFESSRIIDLFPMTPFVRLWSVGQLDGLLSFLDGGSSREGWKIRGSKGDQRGSILLLVGGAYSEKWAEMSELYIKKAWAWPNAAGWTGMCR